MHGLVFDLDETLIDRRSAVTAFARTLWERFISSTEISFGRFVEDVHQLDGYGYIAREQFFEQMWQKYAGNIPAKKAIEQAFYQEVWETPRLADGVMELLPELKTDGVPLAIVSNGSTKAQETKIRHSGIGQFFDVIVISEAFGVKKPDPSIYKEAASGLGMKPNECWFIGDHPINDIWGSKQVGYHTAWVHLDRPWAADLEQCYDVKGATFSETMQEIALRDSGSGPGAT